MSAARPSGERQEPIGRHESGQLWNAPFFFSRELLLEIGKQELIGCKNVRLCIADKKRLVNLNSRVHGTDSVKFLKQTGGEGP
jgi:hypothetical protein